MYIYIYTYTYIYIYIHTVFYLKKCSQNFEAPVLNTWFCNYEVREFLVVSPNSARGAILPGGLICNYEVRENVAVSPTSASGGFFKLKLLFLNTNS